MTAETRTTAGNPALQPRRGRMALVLLVAAGVAAGIYIGMRWHTTFERWLVPGDRMAASGASDASTAASGRPAVQKQLWTCGMHPQVIQDHPGDCPICHMKLTPLVTADSGNGDKTAQSPTAPKSGERKVKYWHDPMMNPPYISDRPGKSPMGMDLVPVYEDEAKPAGAAVVIDPAIVQNMGVRTVAVIRGVLARQVRATANIVEPEPARTDVNLRVSGWIQKLYASTEGMAVRKGDPLFDLYSPDLRLAVEELITARRAVHGSVGTALAQSATGDALVAAAELRLQTLGLSEDQIKRLGELEHAPSTVTFESPVDGIVVAKANIYNGSSVMSGQMVMRIADRSVMWVEARVPEGSLAHLRVGQHANVVVNALGDKAFEGEVIFIHPNLDELTRTALVRMAVPNPDGTLRLGMYAISRINTSATQEANIVPREAVIDSGESRLVFVSTRMGRFEPRRVTLGASGDGGMVEITSGLTPGEMVVASGQFLLDSESRIREAIAKFLGQDASSSSVPPASPAQHTEHDSVGDAKAPAVLVDRVIAEYMAISEPLGQEQPDTPPAKVDGLLSAIDGLMEKAEGADAKRLGTDARQAVAAMQSQSTDKQRELFKSVSAAVIALVEAMPPSAPVAASLYVANCPMAKADWLQRSEELANPYYAEDMKECGTIVRRVGEKLAPSKRGAP
ncbi:MAG: efflux RND transporter periplasmic adaptor subunit [Phycisphaerales bacterium]